ncbi:hypothetical protein OG21DRAFT_1527030 [Imleria badia]|nr:hypothetical protein OG21DRAFT_1527030 [Imleria badia]
MTLSTCRGSFFCYLDSAAWNVGGSRAWIYCYTGSIITDGVASSGFTLPLGTCHDAFLQATDVIPDSAYLFQDTRKPTIGTQHCAKWRTITIFPSKALLSLILIRVTLSVVDASPLSRRTGKTTLSFATRINESGTLNVVEKHRARAQALKNAGHLGKRAESISVTPANAQVIHTAQVGVGGPATDFSGEEWTDTVSLGPGLVIEKQSIGVASSATGFDGFDGILGIDPAVPNRRHDHQHATLALVNYVPLTTTSPASAYWGINQSITYGGTNILSSTGTTQMLIATDAFQKYQSVTGGTPDTTMGFSLLPPSLSSPWYANLQTLSFSIQVGGPSYDLIPNAQIWPHSLNYIIGGRSGRMVLPLISSMATPFCMISSPGIQVFTSSKHSKRFCSVFAPFVNDSEWLTRFTQIPTRHSEAAKKKQDRYSRVGFQGHDRLTE